MAKPGIDAIDRRILAILQENGRLSNQEIAERINLSPSPCLRRIRRLEESGVIRGYVALLDAQRLGLDLLAYVSVRLEKGGGRAFSPHGEATHADLFGAAVQTWPANSLGAKRSLRRAAFAGSQIEKRATLRPPPSHFPVAIIQAATAAGMNDSNSRDAWRAWRLSA
jgi:DNA-binding Lrp family transcriptional regulator